MAMVPLFLLRFLGDLIPPAGFFGRPIFFSSPIEVLGFSLHYFSSRAFAFSFSSCILVDSSWIF